jgi:hypothetical protein
MRTIFEIIGDLMQLRSPFRANDPVELAMTLAQWVFLLIVALTVTAVLLVVFRGV